VPTRLSARDRRQQILDVASGIFARKGYQGATTREIAEEAGVNEALLFRHFPSKESLYWTMLEELCLAGGRHDRMKRILKEGEGENDLVVFQSIAPARDWEETTAILARFLTTPSQHFPHKHQEA
jgi:AcrR family transcriptional regulator